MTEMWPRKKVKDCKSHEALAEAQERLAEVKDRSEEVHKVKRAAQDILARNHLAEQLGGLMWGSKP